MKLNEIVAPETDRETLGGSKTLREGHGFNVYSWMSSMPLTSAEMMVFAVLYALSGKGQRETTCGYLFLSEMCCVSVSSLKSTVMPRLEQLGLVRRCRAGHKLRVSVFAQSEAVPGDAFVRIDSWMSAFLDLKASELLLWAYFFSLSEKGNKAVAFHRSYVAAHTGLSVASVTRILSSLEGKGLIERYANVNDEGGCRVGVARPLVPECAEPYVAGGAMRSELNDRAIGNVPSSAQIGTFEVCNFDNRANESEQASAYFCAEEQIQDDIANVTSQGMADGGATLEGDELEGFSKLRSLSLKPVSDRKALAAYREALSEGYSAQEIVERYTDFRRPFESGEKEVRFAPALHRWLVDPGYLHCFAPCNSSPNAAKMDLESLTFAQIYSAFSRTCPDLGRLCLEYNSDKCTDGRRREIAAEARELCGSVLSGSSR